MRSIAVSLRFWENSNKGNPKRIIAHQNYSLGEGTSIVSTSPSLQAYAGEFGPYHVNKRLLLNVLADARLGGRRVQTHGAATRCDKHWRQR